MSEYVIAPGSSETNQKPVSIKLQDGLLGVSNGCTESTLNTSNTPLDGSATYQGTFEQNIYPDVMTSVETDQDGTLYYDFSVDGTNYSTFPVNGVKVNAGIHEFHTAVKGPRYFRVRFINDSSSAQTYFRCYTFYGSFGQGNAPLNQSAGVDADAIIVRPTDFRYEVAQGLRGGASTWNKWGKGSIGTTEETAWITGGNHVRVTSAQPLHIRSDNVNDTSGGSGMRSVIIYGVGSGWVEQTEIKTLTGSAYTTTSLDWIGVNRIAGYSHGATGFNEGKITAISSGSGVQSDVSSGLGVTQQCFFFVPYNRVALMDWLWINAVKLSGGGQPVLTTKCLVYSDVVQGTYQVFESELDTQRQSALDVSPSQPFPVGQKSYVQFRVKSDTANTGYNVRFSTILNQII